MNRNDTPFAFFQHVNTNQTVTVNTTSQMIRMTTYRGRWERCRCIMTVWAFTIRMRWFLHKQITHTHWYVTSPTTWLSLLPHRRW